MKIKFNPAKLPKGVPVINDLYKSFVLVFGLCVLCILTPVRAWPQAATATITGVIRDTSGAAVPGSRVTARNVQTNITREAVTSPEGEYTLPLLNIGQYEVTVDKDGFRKTVQSGVDLQVDQKARLDLTLSVGDSKESITVSAEASSLQTESASTGTVIDNKKTVELPLNTRSYYDLTQLTTNVAPPTGSLTAGTSTSFSVAGQNQNSNSFILNGLDNNNNNVNGGGFRPSIDAIQEFRILTGIYSAEYGRLSAGQIVVVVKSGSNQFHGDAYDFLRNSYFDARNFFLKGPLPSLKRNLFGATVGGPIRRDKTFFFASYEGLRLIQGNIYNVTVPTTAMVQGNFAGLPVTVRDPITKTPYPNNVIPPSLINPVGAGLASFYPAPTAPTPAGSLPTNNYSSDPTTFNNSNQTSIRIDHTLTSKDTLYGTANYYRNPNTGAAAFPIFGSINLLTAQQHGIAETHIFSPNLINEFRFGFSRSTQGNTQADHGIAFISQYGIANVFDPSYQPVCPAGAGDHCNNGVPSVAITGFQGLGGGTANPQQSHIYSYQEVDNLIWTRGSQTIRFGGDIRRGDTNWEQTASGRGVFNFTAPANSSTLPTSGYDFADLLLGYPSSVSRNPFSQNYYQRDWGIDPYVQDDWKVNSRLTVNMGLRWEINTPVVNLNHSVSNFDPSTGQVFTPGLGGYPLNTWKYNWHDLAPRLGLAWQPLGDSKTVVRAGAGLFYNQLGSVITFPLALNYPHRLAQTFNSSVANPISLSNPFPPIPNTALPPPTDGSLTLTAVNQNFADAVQQQWTINVQRSLSANTIIEVGYLGSEGTHLLTQNNINQPTPSPAGTTTAQIQAKRPYPAFGNITFEESAGNMSYNSLEAKVEKRYSNGFSATAAYTFGKSIVYPGSYFGSTAQNGNPQDSRDLAAARGLSPLDLRHRFVSNGIWALPFGHDHALLNKGPLAYIVGDWQLSAILTAQTGRPVFVSMGGANISNTLGGTDMPNVVANCNTNNGPKTLSQWFNASCFVTPPIGSFGNEGFDNVIGPGLFNMDVSLSRSFVWRERFRAQFRADTYNILNHPNFGQPGGTVGSSSLGTITSALDPRQFQLGLKLYF